MTRKAIFERDSGEFRDREADYSDAQAGRGRRWGRHLRGRRRPPARAEDALSSLAAQPSPIDTPDGPKEQLRRVGITPDVWVTQIYQGEPGGDGGKTWTYGGKIDGFLKIDAEKLGLWTGLHVNVQYEHYFGENINRKDSALIPVNTAQAYLGEGTFHTVSG